MKNKKLYDYLISIRNFLKYGFTDDNVSLLGISKLEKEQGQHDGELCVLAYDLPQNHDCILAGSSYAKTCAGPVKRNSLEHSNYNITRCKKEGK